MHSVSCWDYKDEQQFTAKSREYKDGTGPGGIKYDFSSAENYA
ncbi:hypothetical protein [Cedecea lapagei]|nr:hypothetical protein [Cedecea lapagei]